MLELIGVSHHNELRRVAKVLHVIGQVQMIVARAHALHLTRTEGEELRHSPKFCRRRNQRQFRKL
jgi:hypothetical protein